MEAKYLMDIKDYSAKRGTRKRAEYINDIIYRVAPKRMTTYLHAWDHQILRT